MTEHAAASPVGLETPGDAALISATRDGDVAAFGVLYGRHMEAARRLARQLVGAVDADDLAAEGFTKVLTAIQNGKGPTESFRAYLLTAIRSIHVDRIRASTRLSLTDDEESLDRRVEFIDPAALDFERGAAAQAFRSLPERWQLVLWHLDVEGQKPADIAPLLEMSPNSVSALAYRAREGLRQAYLQGHLNVVTSDDCRWATARLGGYVRKALATRDTRKVETHLDDCARCTGLYLELREVNADLGAVLAPALLGTAALGYLHTATGIAGAAKLVGLGIAKVTIEPARSAGRAMGPAGVAAVAVLAVAAAGTAVTMTGHEAPPKPPAPAVEAVTQEAPPAPPVIEPPVEAPAAPVPAPRAAPKPLPTQAPVPTPRATTSMPGHSDLHRCAPKKERGLITIAIDTLTGTCKSP